jgi:hypothetical protein
MMTAWTAQARGKRPPSPLRADAGRLSLSKGGLNPWLSQAHSRGRLVVEARDEDARHPAFPVSVPILPFCSFSPDVD